MTRIIFHNRNASTVKSSVKFLNINEIVILHKRITDLIFNDLDSSIDAHIVINVHTLNRLRSMLSKGSFKKEIDKLIDGDIKNLIMPFLRRFETLIATQIQSREQKFKVAGFIYFINKYIDVKTQFSPDFRGIINIEGLDKDNVESLMKHDLSYDTLERTSFALDPILADILDSVDAIERI